MTRSRLSLHPTRRQLLTSASAAALAAAGLIVTSDVGRDLSGADRATTIAAPNVPTIFGVHTRLTDEVETWKIQKTLDMVRDLGAGWIVELFPWPYIEPRWNQLDWKHPDTVIDEAAKRGLRIIARLDMVPDWARPPQSATRYLDPDHYPDFARFAGTFAGRYGDRVGYFVVWNEPNTGFELGFRRVDARDYVALLRQVSATIRANQPTAKILSAGLAPTVEWSDTAVDDLTYLQQIYDAGARELFDIVNVHAYGWKFPPASDPAPDRLNFRRVELTRAIMVRNGDAAKPVIITESGWNDSPRWTKSVRPAQRITYTLDALDYAHSAWPWLGAMNIWNFRLPAPTHNYNDYFTLVDPEFRPKPIYYALQAAAGRWRLS